MRRPNFSCWRARMSLCLDMTTQFSKLDYIFYSCIYQGVEWEYLSKPPSPCLSLAFSDMDWTASTKSTNSSTPSPSPTNSQISSPAKSRSTGLRSKTPSESSMCRSPLLEEFRNHMGSFEDLCEIRGHVLEFSRDQVGLYHSKYNHIPDTFTS